MARPDFGHAFISYVREDKARVDQLQQALEAAGVRVWRDTSDLWPGDDWRLQIRRAISDDALAFVACFSSSSDSRRVNGQNDELFLAVDQLRRRRPEDAWLIPLRFDNCAIPDLEIGGGRTLASLQRIDLFEDGPEQTERLVQSVLRILDRRVPGGGVRDARVGRVIATEEQIASVVASLGRELTTDYEGRNPVIVSVVPGSEIFVSDLLRRIDTSLTFETTRISAYGNASFTSGVVRIHQDVDVDLSDRDVILVVADAAGPGPELTLSYLRRTLSARGTRSLEICALAITDAAALVQPPAFRYVGFVMPPVELVGYGLSPHVNLPFLAERLGAPDLPPSPRSDLNSRPH